MNDFYYRKVDAYKLAKELTLQKQDNINNDE